MHNSGTSLMGGLLHAAGLPLGDRLLMRNNIPAERRPTYDYFEDSEVVELQDSTLKSLNRHWSCYQGSFPLPPEDSSTRISFREQLTKIVRNRFKKNQNWVVKDPRIGVLLEDWLYVLNTLKIKTYLLIVHRAANNNIISFSQKGQIPKLWAEALWQRTYTNAMVFGKTLPNEQVFLTSFERLMRNPEKETRDICQFLQWPINKSISKEIEKRFKPELSTVKSSEQSSLYLQKETQRIEEKLLENTWQSYLYEEGRLISFKIESSLQQTGSPLELNTLFRNEQSSLPKIKVTIVTAEFQNFGNCGGIGSAYHELAKALLDAGHSVKLILVSAFHQKPINTIKGLQIEQIDPTAFSRLEQIRLIASRIKESSSDVIHLHDWLGFGSGLKDYLGSDRPKIVIGLHGPSAWARSGNPWARNLNGEIAENEERLYDEGLVRALEKDALLNADLIISPSRFMADWVSNHLFENKTKPSIIIQRNCTLSTRIKINLPYRDEDYSHSKNIIYFGRLEERKGLVLFLKSIEKVKKPPEKIIFLGADCLIKKGEMGSDLVKSKLKQLSIDFEFFTNLNRDEALQFLKKNNCIVVIPSLIENSPCVVEELLDSGIRLVVTDVGGSREMIDDSCLKWLSMDNPENLAKNIEDALHTREEEAYLLKAKIPSWEISLSWQAFHQRIPRRNSAEIISNRIDVKPHLNQLGLIKRIIVSGGKRIRAKLRKII